MRPDSGAAPSRNVIAVPVAILCACALVAIILILRGSGVDETSARLLGTAVSLALASLMVSACLSLVRRRPSLALLGYVGVLTAAVALLFGVGAIWQLGDSDLGRPFGVALVIAIACAHASLLLGGAREADTDAIRLVRAGTLGSMSLLGLLLCVEILTPRSEDVSWRAVGVLAVLYLLGTLLLPLMRTGAWSGRQAAVAVSEAGPPPGAHLDGVIAQLRSQGFVVVAGPAPRQGAHGPAQGVSFRDPNGRLLELIAY